MSWTEALLTWRRERAPHALFLPFSALLVIASLPGRPQPAVLEIALSLLLAWGLVVQLRLWDDLEDRETDRSTHPDRVLVRSSSLHPFFILLGALVAFNLTLLTLGTGGPWSALAFVALHLVLGLWYRRLREFTGPSGFPILLLKYPVFVLLIRSEPPSALDVSGLLPALALYVSVCVYEVLHDPIATRETMNKSVAFGTPSPEMFEPVACYHCGSDSRDDFVTAQEDLTGKPGDFTFAKCRGCGLVYQHPRIDVEHIRAYYDEEYIAHRKKNDWGVMAGFFEWVMDKLDRDKDTIIRRYVTLNQDSEVLDVGCGAGTFLTKMHKRYGARLTGVDFKDVSTLPGFESIDFRCGLFYEQELKPNSFDLVTMWHFLEHDYDPVRSLETARQVVKAEGHVVIEVPRLDSLSFTLFHERWPGLQAPQHTALYDRKMLLNFVKKAGFEIVDYLPYGAYPAYFYLFAGTAFKLLKGRGLDLSRAIYPYFLGQLLLSPVLLFEKRMNLAMQMVVCRKAG